MGLASTAARRWYTCMGWHSLGPAALDGVSLDCHLWTSSFVKWMSSMSAYCYRCVGWTRMHLGVWPFVMTASAKSEHFSTVLVQKDCSLLIQTTMRESHSAPNVLCCSLINEIRTYIHLFSYLLYELTFSTTWSNNTFSFGIATYFIKLNWSNKWKKNTLSLGYLLTLSTNFLLYNTDMHQTRSPLQDHIHMELLSLWCNIPVNNNNYYNYTIFI